MMKLFLLLIQLTVLYSCKENPSPTPPKVVITKSAYIPVEVKTDKYLMMGEIAELEQIEQEIKEVTNTGVECSIKIEIYKNLKQSKRLNDLLNLAKKYGLEHTIREKTEQENGE